MTPLQFTLFFVALLVGYVLVHLRLVRFEEHLQKLAGIRGLDDRLRQLDERLHYLYLGTWPAQAMNLPFPSGGQRYLDSFKDKDGNWNSPPSLLQFKNVYVKELK